jgi:hypothetical protein
MPFTAPTIPSQVTALPAPWDVMTAFTDNQIITATGYLSNLNSGLLDLGSTNQSIGGGAGRVEGIWSLNISAIDMSSGDESYQFALLGSNDSTFANGNVELLAFHDVAASAAVRFIANLLGASPAIPPNGRLQFPFNNLVQKITYRYLKCRVIIAGTTPSVTVTSWISRSEIMI